jgi:thymidylate kinase
VDFVVGHLLLYLPVLRTGGTVIIERGWQDLIVDPKRYLLPARWLARILGVVVPAPDIVVVLDAPPTVLQQRKQELSLEEIRRQLDEWKATAKARRKVVQLDALEPPDVLVEHLIPFIEPAIGQPLKTAR